MKAVIPLVLAIAWHLPLHAADALPSYLTGVWGTAESLDTGTAAQSFLHLAADGYGFAVGSGPVKRMDGKDGGGDDGKQLPRPVIGFPVRAMLDGDLLTLLPYWPGKIDEAQAARQVLSCRYDASAPALNCTTVNGVAIRLQRRAEQLDAETAKQIEAVRSPPPFTLSGR
ncbi:hypothetical protein SRABI118_00619 [Massilia sp. Bi118]|uniref:hypothetical protein n=1 Tax=Massilia sp. Bi118 TaxID=2822346 RepID=UPI001E00EEE6|nr:hypothetical protein [Massilia sp. Bi118]CAH0155329.1 hypothetical protein SRABI118_00619 [Massilia sp. Bi118]